MGRLTLNHPTLIDTKYSQLVMLGDTLLELLHTKRDSLGPIFATEVWTLGPANLHKTRDLCYRKDGRSVRPIYGCPEDFLDSLTMPTATYPKSFHGLLL